MPPQIAASRRDFLKSSAALAGASILAGCESAAPDLATHSQFPTLHPEHNERTRGWLRFLWEKATTPDDWSYGGRSRIPGGTSTPRRPCELSRFDLSIPVTQCC